MNLSFRRNLDIPLINIPSQGNNFQKRRNLWFQLLALTGQASEHWERPAIEQLREGIIHTVVPEPEEEHAIQVGPDLQAEGPQDGDHLGLPNACSYDSIKEDELMEGAREIFHNLEVKKCSGTRPYCVYYQFGRGAAPAFQKICRVSKSSWPVCSNL